MTGLAQRADASSQEMFLIGRMSAVAGCALASCRRRMRNSHRQLRLHVFVAREAQIGLRRGQDNAARFRMAGIARPIRKRRMGVGFDQTLSI